MAYVPPHKRRSDGNSPPPSQATFPDYIYHRFERFPILVDPFSTPKIVYAGGSNVFWCPVGAISGGDAIPTSFFLAPFPAARPVELFPDSKPFVLARSESVAVDRVSDDVEEFLPWKFVAEKVLPELVKAAERARWCQKNMPEVGEIGKIAFIARFGKVLFYSAQSANLLESIKKAASHGGDYRREISKSFYTNILDSLIEALEHNVLPKLGFRLYAKKDYYIVTVSDNNNPNTFLNCKCALLEETERLELKKIELSNLRHLVADVSCLYKDHDLRLMLLEKRTLEVLDVHYKADLNELLKLAVKDTNVKGGLRWSLGSNSMSRFSITKAWQVNRKVFENNGMKLKLRRSDRYDYLSSTVEVANEVSIKLTDITKILKEDVVEINSLTQMVQDAFKIIWENFLDFKDSKNDQSFDDGGVGSSSHAS